MSHLKATVSLIVIIRFHIKNNTKLKKSNFNYIIERLGDRHFIVKLVKKNE